MGGGGGNKSLTFFLRDMDSKGIKINNCPIRNFLRIGNEL